MGVSVESIVPCCDELKPKDLGLAESSLSEADTSLLVSQAHLGQAGGCRVPAAASILLPQALPWHLITALLILHQAIQP